MHFLIYNPPNATHKELFSWAEFQEYTIQAVMKTFQKTDVSMKVVQMDCNLQQGKELQVRFSTPYR